MSRTYELVIEGQKVSVTPTYNEMIIFLDMKKYSIQVVGEEIEVTELTNQSSLEGLVNNFIDIPEAKRLTATCVECDGKIICQEGPCVETDCGTFCR